MKIEFYEKQNCAGNKKQRELLESFGVEIEQKDLLSETLSKDELKKFFKDLEVKECFNPFSPKVKKREINIENISLDEAIEIMIREPILIKRPLIKYQNTYICGFDIDKINNFLSIKIDKFNPFECVTKC